MADSRISISKKLVEGALKRSFEDAQVPRGDFLKVVRALHQALKRHKGDRQAHQEFLGRVAKRFDEHEKRMEAHEQNVKSLHQGVDKASKNMAVELERVKGIKKGEPGRPGPRGDDGVSIKLEDVVSEVLKLLPPPAKGEPGDAAEIDEEKLLTKFLALIKSNRLIEARDVKGIQQFMKDGVRYRVEELMHGGGFGGGSILIPVSGNIDNANTQFVFTRKPALVNVNGTFYREGKGWAWTASTQTVTLDGPVGSTGDIYAV